MRHITLRPVQSADAPFLTHLMNIPSLLQRLHQMPTALGDWQEAISLWLQDDDEEGYILLRADQPIGWFAVNNLKSPNRIPYLKIAVLLPDFQGKRLGEFVIRQLMNEMKSRGFPALRLLTDSDNFSAQVCYRKCGFEVIRKVESDWPDGSVNWQYEMEKTL